MDTIDDARNALMQALNPVLETVLPQTAGFTPLVEIFENYWKSANQDQFRPALGEIRIKFVPGAAPLSRRTTEKTPSNTWVETTSDAEENETDVTPAMTELIKALDSANPRRGFEGVYLEWFREWYVAAGGLDSPYTLEVKEDALRRAIHDGIILTMTVPSPLSPTAKVTAIRLNYGIPEVGKVLWGPYWIKRDFKPVTIRGEPLSETVIRQRRGI